MTSSAKERKNIIYIGIGEIAVGYENDVLKISFSVNESKMLEKIETLIYHNIRAVCEDKEREILMSIWIDKLKKVIIDFEEMKKLHPKEFTLRLDEIANTIEVFKKKIT